MLRSKSFRLVLVILLLGGILAIGISYISRWSPEPKGKRADLLKPEQSRSLTDAVYQERKDGNLTFEVRADWSAEGADGVISLKNVGLTRFDAQGKPGNLVSGKEALYDRQGKQIRFTGDVHLRLADGTDVYSNSITADLQTEVVNISEKFRFERGDASGRGESLEYRIGPKQVSIKGQFYLALPLDEGQTTIEADEAFHDLTSHTVDLTRNARIAGQGNRLSADRIKVEMTEQNRVRRLTGSGQGQLEVGRGRLFQGEQIDMSFDPEQQSLTKLDISGGDTNRKATYQEETAGGSHYLEALQIVASPEKKDKDVFLKDFRADRNVLFRSQPLKVTEARAEHLVGFLAPGGKDLQRVHLEGSVSVLRQVEEKKSAKGSPAGLIADRLSSEELDLRFTPGQTLEEAWALRRVDLKQTSSSFTRNLTARDSVRLFYTAGQLSRSESRGDSRLTEDYSGGRRTAAAPSMDAFFSEGQLQRMTAEGGVLLTTEEKGVSRTATSRTLEAGYARGELIEVIQRGGVRIRDEQEKSRVDLRAETSRYDARAGVLTLSEGAPVLRYSSSGDAARQETETSAKRIELYRQTDRIVAQGSVKTVLSQNGDLIVVEAGRMEGDRKSGWAVYSESPRITQKAGSVSGGVVRYNSQDQTVQVDNDVVSNLTDEQGKKYRVTAQHLVYDRQSGRARYEDSVQVKGTDINLKAPFVELVFKEEKRNQVSQVVAWGGVEVVQGDKIAKGQRAVYFPDTQKVEMTAGVAAAK
ncbi:MAG: LPS export ABC transporter periplasmic protein LptC [Acidobacteria bacterium]|nr:MAG: LPS export ABC transporter periplasmic protein LptC [Acidobacteriota bacterium]